jgi:hypothetical protein
MASMLISLGSMNVSMFFESRALGGSCATLNTFRTRPATKSPP